MWTARHDGAVLRGGKRLGAVLLASALAGTGAVVPRGPALAAPALYTDAALAADTGRVSARFVELLSRGLGGFMTGGETRALGEVVLDHPPRGRDLFAIDTTEIDGSPLITLPVESLKLIEDLSTAYAWRQLHGYSLEPIDEYMAMLKYRPAASWPGGRPPGPLEALGVPARVWETEKDVDDLSLRLRNTAWGFMLAHELGHVLQHHAATGGKPEEVQRQEQEADAFAAGLLARSGTIPMGMILWLQATAGYRPNRADFDSDAAWAAWLADRAEHPVNGARMRSLAQAMARQADKAGSAQRADVLRFIADRLAVIGSTVEDPAMQGFLHRCAMARNPADLARRADMPCGGPMPTPAPAAPVEPDIDAADTSLQGAGRESP